MIENQLIVLADEDRHIDCCANQRCRVCGSHVSTYDAHGPGHQVCTFRPEAEHEDWWVACDNAECEHAYGEGLFQVGPDWIEKRTGS